MNDKLLQAIILAVDAHGEAVDKAGNLYILHPLHVMEQVDETVEKIVAVLHDVIEDTDAELHPQGIAFNGRLYPFSTDVIEALDAITKRKGEKLEDYWSRVALNQIAYRVKLADIDHNSSEKRLANLSIEEANYLREKYRRARLILLRKHFEPL